MIHNAVGMDIFNPFRIKAKNVTVTNGAQLVLCGHGICKGCTRSGQEMLQKRNTGSDEKPATCSTELFGKLGKYIRKVSLPHLAGNDDDCGWAMAVLQFLLRMRRRLHVVQNLMSRSRYGMVGPNGVSSEHLQY